MTTKTKPASDSSGGVFLTTRWAVVTQARDGDPAEAHAALEELCLAYWRPVYAFVRRSGRQPADAQDLTQEFFRRFIEKEWIRHLQHQRGKFRSFLLTFLKHFLSDERDRANARKRGGGLTFLSLDELQAEEGHLFEPAAFLSADEAFERRWAETVMDRAIARLRRQYAGEGKSGLFERLKDLHPGERGAQGYAELGMALGLSESAVKSAVHRLRLRHREALRREIAQTLGEGDDVDAEIRHLIEVLGK